jgi:hypothetical protein
MRQLRNVVSTLGNKMPIVEKKMECFFNHRGRREESSPRSYTECHGCLDREEMVRLSQSPQGTQRRISLWQCRDRLKVPRIAARPDRKLSGTMSSH